MVDFTPSDYDVDAWAMTKKKRSAKTALIAKIHIAKKTLCLDDDTYRDVLRLATSGKTSCKDMDIAELERVLYAMQKKGFKPTSKNKGSKPRVAQSRQRMLSKIEALLADDGKHWNYAKAMAKRMFGKEAIEFLTDAEMHKLTQALAVAQRRKQNKAEAHTG